jgi:hypothetical protein
LLYDFCLGRFPVLELLQVRHIEPQDNVDVVIAAIQRQPVLLGHALGLLGGDIEGDAAVLVFVQAESR